MVKKSPSRESHRGSVLAIDDVLKGAAIVGGIALGLLALKLLLEEDDDED